MASDTAPENLPYGRRVLRSETGSRQLLSPFEQESTDYAQPDGPGTTTPPPDALPEAEGPAADGQAFARVGPRLSAVPSHNGSVVSSFVDAKGEAHCQPTTSAGFSVRQQHLHSQHTLASVWCNSSAWYVAPPDNAENSWPSLPSVVCAAKQPHSGTSARHLSTVPSSLQIGGQQFQSLL